MSRVAVAVSGGADSLFALVSLQEQGHEVLALHGLFLPSSSNASDAVSGLGQSCETLGIPLHVLDLRTRFDHEVMAPFVQAYAEGRTPNPCALCNAGIKFGVLLDAARELGVEFLATGHYASLLPHALYAPKGGRVLAKGQDAHKDQSYFLALVPRERLQASLFPLATTVKQENVAFLQQRGMTVPLPKESQDVCFVPADAYRPFLEEQALARQLSLSGPGPMVVLEEGRHVPVGCHQGLWRYTEGQRRGLGVAWKEPLYVLGKDRDSNALLLAAKADLRLQGCVLGSVNYLVPQELWPETLLARVRYRQREAVVTVEGTATAGLRILFHEPQSPTAPGQLAVIYDAEGVVLAGGIIEEVH